ncbi:MAG: DUF2116 family Zn-ribbon domain-containing protein [Nitrososphaerales archaeon]
MSRTERIQPHRHCNICGKATPLKQEFCSPECKGKDAKSVKKSRRISRFYTIVLIVIFLSVVLFSFLT